MLVFTRKPNESFVIQVGAGITITVVSVTGRQVRIGVDADKSIPVYRTEVAEAIERDGKK